MDRFAFIIHPLERKIFTGSFPAEKMPETVVDQFVKLIPPLNVAHITGIKSKTGMK